MDKVLLVFVGGGLGAVGRLLVGQQALRWVGPGWPHGTFAVNILGGLLMGLLAGWLAHKGGADQARWSLLLGVGLLGGFTTFSAFSLETALMLERREVGAALLYAAGSVALSVAALWLGLLVSRRVWA
ncbi:MAG TPA: fluoride efflux transporter CrcB [Caulobacteraceae bacterium]|jgi:CrcB protein